jgi:hypothetical protein
MPICATPKIDREFADLCPPLTPEERSLLEASIEADGCRDALVVWKENGLLLDGHNRIEICGVLGKSYRTKELSLPDRAAAVEWIIANQLGRRNVSDEQKSYLRGKRYQHEKRKDGARGPSKKPGQNVPASDRTSAKIAAETHVDEKTIRRDAEFATAVDRLAEVCGKEAKAGVTHLWLIKRLNPLRPIRSGLAAAVDEAIERAERN